MRFRLGLLPLCIVLCGCARVSGPLEIHVEKRDEHPFLSDHARVLAATIGGRVIDTRPIYPDPGAGSPLHYVETPDHIIAVDCNGMWYRITRGGISKLGWRWLQPLPGGTVRRISLNDRDEYVTTIVENPALSDIYRYKDPDG